MNLKMSCYFVYLLCAGMVVFSCKSRKSSKLFEYSGQQSQAQPEVEEGDYGLEWMDDYSAAAAKAKSEKKMLFVVLRHQPFRELTKRFFREALADPDVQELLSKMVLVRIPYDAKRMFKEKESEIISLVPFYYLGGDDGILIGDFVSSEKSPNYGQYVSAFPLVRFDNNHYNRPDGGTLVRNKYLHYAVEKPATILAMLRLPLGSITQRTLIYATRIHFDQPLSASGENHPYLQWQATHAADLQVRMRAQGHHNWNTRFADIQANLGRGYQSPYENASESWPNNLTILDSALECIETLRGSSGHWAAALFAFSDYGYDMAYYAAQRKWFCTGVYANKTGRPVFPENLNSVIRMNKGQVP